MASHRGAHSCQPPTQGLQCGTNVCLTSLRIMQESLKLGEVEWDEAHSELTILTCRLCISILTIDPLVILREPILLVIDQTLAIVLTSLVLVIVRSSA